MLFFENINCASFWSLVMPLGLFRLKIISFWGALRCCSNSLRSASALAFWALWILQKHLPAVFSASIKSSLSCRWLLILYYFLIFVYFKSSENSWFSFSFPSTSRSPFLFPWFFFNDNLFLGDHFLMVVSSLINLIFLSLEAEKWQVKQWW